MKTKNHSENEKLSNPQVDPRQKRSALWIVLVFFISGWVFFLGVIVGRSTAPALFDYKKIDTEIKMLAKTFSSTQKVKNDTESDILATQAELAYPEELRKHTEDTAKIPVPATTPAPEKAPKPAKPAEIPVPAPQEPAQALLSPAPVKPDIQTAAKPEAGKPEPVENEPDVIKPVAETKIKSMYDVKPPQSKEMVPERPVAVTPERTPAAVPKPRPPQPAASDNNAPTAQPVAIHLSSLVDRKSADALIESLRNKGISASKTPKMVPGKGVWYMVVIGKYASSTEADAMLNRLRQENVDVSLVKQ